MQKKTLWILFSRKDATQFPNKQLKIDSCVSYATKKNIPIKFLDTDVISLDTKQPNSEFPTAGEFVLHVTKSSEEPSKTAYILSFLESLGVRMVNSPTSVGIMGDKWLTNSILAHAGIPVPHTKLISVFDTVTKQTFADMQFPVVAKVLNGSLGEGVFWVDTYTVLEDLITFSRSQSPTEKHVLVQEAIVASKGSDIRVIVLNGKVLGAIKRTNTGDSFKANIRQGGSATLFPIDEKLKNYSEKIVSVLGIGFTGIDFLVDDSQNYYLTEVNAFPGFKGFESIHTEINLAKELIETYL